MFARLPSQPHEDERAGVEGGISLPEDGLVVNAPIVSRFS